MSSDEPLDLSYMSMSLSPAPGFVIHDHKDIEKRIRLERYFDDLYHLFLEKVVSLREEPVVSTKERKELDDLFQELLRIKAELQQGLGE